MKRAIGGTIAGMTQKKTPDAAEIALQKPEWFTYDGT